MSENRSSEKFKVSRKPDFREEKSVNMTLRIDKELQNSMKIGLIKPIVPEMNLCAWRWLML